MVKEEIKNAEGEDNDNKSVAKNDREETPDPEEVEEVLKALPEESRPSVRRIFESLSIQPFVSPIAKQVTSQHISDSLKYADDQDVRDRKERNHIRFFSGILLLILLAFSCFLIYFLIERDPTLLRDIIKYATIFGGGGGLGFGISEYRHRRR